MAKTRGGANYGIQADTVKAKNLAVGPHAQATLIEGESARVDEALNELRRMIDSLDLQAAMRDHLESDLTAIETEVKKNEPGSDRMESLLKGLADKLKMVGTIVKEGSDCIEPLKKIASAVGIGLAALGL